MSSEERDMILQMVAEGKVTTAEAADLLDALDTKEDRAGEDGVGAESRDVYRNDRDQRRQERDARRFERDLGRQDREQRRKGFADRVLEIHVQDGGETRTHVNIPLGMAVAAGRFLPKKAQDYFDRYGIDLNDLLDSVSSDLSRRGDIVDVTDGDTHVHLAII